MGDTEDVNDRVSAALDHFDEEHFKEISQLIDRLPEICVDDLEASNIARERSLERCIFILDLYQEQPHLLDPKIPVFVQRLLQYVRESAIFSSSNGNRRLFFQSLHVLRILIKVRGFKTFTRFMPHEHGDLVPVLRMLEEEENRRTTDDEAAAADVCISEYVLLIWMSMLVKIPFDMSRFDSSATTGENNGKTTSQRIYEAVKRCLVTQDQRREAAAFCLSVFVARPDSIRQYLRSLIFDDILPFFAEVDKNHQIESQYDVKLGFAISARCLLLASLLIRVKREDIPYEWSKAILEKVLSYSRILADSPNILIRKLTTKVVVRSTLTMLKPRIVSWRYERGSRSLAANLGPTGDGGGVSQSSDIPTTMENGDTNEEDHLEIPEETEAAINYLLGVLKDKDTVCRWSAAKGFGRLCARLPHELADQIVSAILGFFDDDFADASRHGACLALAELGRRGLLLPSRLAEVVPLIVRALTYDEQRGTYSVGSNVRDAACYVSWSFARAYAPTELHPYNLQLAVGLLTTAVYDREVNCRRAASAAFQEHVGRQRGEFPHGIDLLTEVDYFAVRNRKHCYRELSVFVAKFPEYTRPMIDHLVEQKVSHWDETIRDLTGDALQNLGAIDPDHFVDTVMPKLMQLSNGYELFACQGAVIALGRSAATLRSRLSPDFLSKLLDLPRRISQSHLFKGLGGELMRKALNDYIFNVCGLLHDRIEDTAAKKKYAEEYRSILNDDLTHQREDIRSGARRAIEALFDAVSPSEANIVGEYVDQLEKAIYEKQRSGACFALSSLPRAVLIQHRATVIGVLIRFSIAGENKRAVDALWAIARRDAVSSLAAVVDKIGPDDEGGGDSGGLTLTELESIVDCYTKALDDYTTDSRGDIGSYVREAAIVGLTSLFCKILESTNRNTDGRRRADFTDDLSKRAVGKVLQQCCEKIDRTRELACASMKNLIETAGESKDRLETALRFPRADILVDVFIGSTIDWTKAGQAYPRLIELLNGGDVFAYPVLLGFAVTAGGLTESSVRASSNALLAYIGRRQNDQDDLRLIVKTITSIFDDHRKVDRVTSPLMKTIEQIFNTNYLDNFIRIDEDGEALEKLLDLVISETRLSKNSAKVLNGLSVCNCFLRFEGAAVCTKALKHASSMLVHPYPGVRREAANRLYESVLSYFSLDNHNEQVLTILSETDWNAEPKELKSNQMELELLLKAD